MELHPLSYFARCLSKWWICIVRSFGEYLTQCKKEELTFISSPHSQIFRWHYVYLFFFHLAFRSFKGSPLNAARNSAFPARILKSARTLASKMMILVTTCLWLWRMTECNDIDSQYIYTTTTVQSTGWTVIPMMNFTFKLIPAVSACKLQVV